MAKLYFRYGAMGSSKTANALMVKFNYEERGQKVLLLKPSIDTRDTEVKSRIGLSSPVRLVDEHENIYNIVYDGGSVDCVIVDEAQFLTGAQVVQLTRVVDELDVPVICYGLRSTFRGTLFEGSEWLMALADTIEEIKTICWCGRKAIMNARILDGEIIYQGPDIFIGGNESYVALCRRHWKEGKYNAQAQGPGVAGEDSQAAGRNTQESGKDPGESEEG